jgi:formate hydrogenlyase transcriptional activator
MRAELQIPPEPALAARYEALVRIAKAISAQRQCKDLFRALTVELPNVVRFDYIAVALHDAESGRVCRHIIDMSTGETIPPPEVDVTETFAWWVFQHQQPLLIPFLDRETRFPRLTTYLREHGMQSACALPLTTMHRKLGSIGFGSTLADAYSAEEVRMLSLVADVVALALDDTLNFEASQRAQEQLVREKDRLKLLLELNNSIASNLELRELLRAIAASVRRVMQCDGVAIHLPESETHLRIFALDFPDSRGYLKEEEVFPMEGTPPGRAYRTGQPIVLNLRDGDELRCETAKPAMKEGLKSGCMLPLVSRNRVLGVLALGKRQENAFTENDVEFMMQVAGQVSIAIENAMSFGLISELKDQLAQEKLYLEDEIRSDRNFEEIIGTSATLRRVLKQVETVAPTDSTVLIYGDTGTGKELIARAIHNLSPRRSEPFVKLNCAAIPTGLLESELFGHEKGAFTGAIAQRIGRFELAHRGTVFLDEVGEIPLELQPKLLRVLQEREFERLGSTRTLRSDAWLIAATNRNLMSMVEEQKFRSDLFYRLNVFPVQIPALRERPEDIPLLVRHFAEQFGRRMNKRIETVSTETMNALARYHWPGNVRELQNVIERAVILSAGPVLNVPLADLLSPAPPHANGGNGGGNGETLLEGERRLILNALEETKWVLAGPSGAAARLGMKRSTLQSRMRKLGIARPSQRGVAVPASLT